MRLLTKLSSPRTRIIARAVDRAYWGVTTGNYFLCGLAYSSTSTQLQVTESYYSQTFTTDSGILYSFWLYGNDVMNFPFSSDQLKSQSLSIQINLGVYDAKAVTKRKISLLY